MIDRPLRESPSSLDPSMDSRGFTLLELVLATFISSLVIGILAVSMSFALRVWERQQNKSPVIAPTVMDLLKKQLALFNGSQATAGSESTTFFTGDKHSITFATDYSVKAISKGMPVIARYVFLPKEKKLFYAEVPFDPYRAQTFQEFLQLKPGKDTNYPRFYASDLEDFSVGYGAEEKESFADSWEGDKAPSAVLLKWSVKDDPTLFSYVVYPNFIFKVTQKPTGTGGDALQSPRGESRRPPATRDRRSGRTR